jgi:hypothetical protein
MMPKYCPGCGAKVKENAKFCSKCGVPIGGAVPRGRKEPSDVVSFKVPAEPTLKVPAEPTLPKHEEIETGSRDAAVAVVIFLIVGVLIAVGWNSSTSNPSSTPSSTPGCTPTGCPSSAPWYGCGTCWPTSNLCATRGTSTYSDDCSLCRECP